MRGQGRVRRVNAGADEHCESNDDKRLHSGKRMMEKEEKVAHNYQLNAPSQ